MLQQKIRKELIRCLTQPVTREDSLEAIALINQTKAIDYPLEIINRYVEKALQQAALLPDQEETHSLFNLARYVYHRQS